MSLQDEISQTQVRKYFCELGDDLAAKIINKVLDAAIESVEHRYRFTVAEYDSGIFDAIKSIQALKVNESEETNGN